VEVVADVGLGPLDDARLVVPAALPLHVLTGQVPLLTLQAVREGREGEREGG
jgi:hypothetical protein